MSPELDAAIRRLNAALSQLETAAAARPGLGASRGDLETELQLMQDDRSRLAEELDGALTRLHRFDAATDDVSRRVQLAILAVQNVLAQAGQLELEEG